MVKNALKLGCNDGLTLANRHMWETNHKNKDTAVYHFNFQSQLHKAENKGQEERVQ